MKHRFAAYRALIEARTESDFQEKSPSPPELLIADGGGLRTYYAPFDHVEAGARLALVGITPGREQMMLALRQARIAMRAGKSEPEILHAAKLAASFGGKLRKNLVAILDHYGFPDRLGIAASADLWGRSAGIAHFTSALRNPVFAVKRGIEKEYSGSGPDLEDYRPFREQLEELRGELAAVPDAFVLPLGDRVAAAIQFMVDGGHLPLERVLNADGKVAEFPHPSGNNGESQTLAKLPELPPVEDYVREKWKGYVAECRADGKPPQPEERYSGTRRSYWERAERTRKALARLPF